LTSLIVSPELSKRAFINQKQLQIHYSFLFLGCDVTHGFSLEPLWYVKQHSKGDTLDDAIENIKDAITTYLQMISEETKDATVYEVEVSV